MTWYCGVFLLKVQRKKTAFSADQYNASAERAPPLQVSMARDGSLPALPADA